ncbi:MAG: PKD domain-containing protein [Bacteroidota bacterium]
MNSGLYLRVCLLITLFLGSLTTKAQVAAGFTASPVSGCSPLLVRFTDASTGGATQWRWDLGNGTISFLQNPSVIYFSPGKYTVKLVARNAASEDSIVKTEYIEVFGNPVVDFSASSITGCYPLAVDFRDISRSGSGDITSWLWDFGDGATSTLQNPSHVYTSARNFSVTLQIRNSNGCVSTLTKTSMIQINTGVLAQFTHDNPQTCKAPVTINFQNQSTGTGVVNYEWDFGDGNTSDLLNPSHTYTTNGTYTVRLIVTNSNGCTDTLVKPNDVTVGSVDAMFTTPASICQGASIAFTNTSVPSPASVVWHYGDGNTGTDMNAVYTYQTAGSYTVKMVANFGACNDSASRTITVLAKPTAAFSTTDTADCKAPFTVNFSNQSANATSYTWYFGDGVTSTLQNPSHIYNNVGNYSVKLVVTNASGCADSITRTEYIRINVPTVTISNLPDSGCTPFAKTFDASIDITDPITSYTWNFGDGNTSNSATPTNTYATEGNYDVSVIVVTASGCTDTARVTRGIIASNKPVAAFSADPRNTCAKNTVSFTNLSTGGATRWLWEFGDSTISNTQTPSHIYQDTGYFDVKLKIWKGGCMDSVLLNDYVHINPPIAKFRTDANCTRPFERVFVDQSIGAEEWHWDFGDGNTSTTPSPTHIYAATGTYTVTLRVVNNTYGCDFTATRQVQIINARAQFTTTDTVVCKGTNVLFTTGLNLADIASLNWNFGDGTPSINSSFSSTTRDHLYSNAGTFSTRLTMTDKNGCVETLTKPRYIIVTGPTAKFAPAVPGACLNNEVSFTDSSTTDGTNPIQQWQWQYGDDITETLTAPPFQHLYTAAGSYIVKLKVTDTQGCADSATLATAFIISNPKANFTTVDTLSCPGRQVRFVNQSTGPGLTYDWLFGDNGTATTQAPTHAYTSDGTYTVKLTVRDMYGCTDSMTKPGYVEIQSPVAFFSMSDSTSNCPPLIINFTNNSTNAHSIHWDFGDSTSSVSANPTHFYNYPGTYYATLTVTSAGGCTSTYQRRISIRGPQGEFTYNPLAGCNPVTVNFSATTNGRSFFVWDFNDGNTITTGDSILSHTYTHPGNYIPKMILIDQTGCQVPITGNDTILVSSINNGFDISTRLLCDSGVITFTDSSTITNGDVITSYHWDFGDGNISTVQNPTYHYNQTGIFYPELITTSQRGCADTLRSAVPLNIVASPQVNITSSGSGCTPLTVTFTGQLAVPDTSAITWQWDFANGNASTSATPVAQNYTTPALYTIILKGTNSSGCSDTTSTIIESYSIPVVSAGQDFILCNGSSQTMQASGAATYAWSPATALDCTNCGSPATNTTNSITYVVTGTSAQGCVARDSIAITVKNRFVMTNSSNDSVCRGSSKKISASGAHSYSWSPANGLDNPNTSEPTATPDVTTTYTVVGSDDAGCFKDTGYVSLKVNPLPTVEAGIDKTINVGQTVDLIPVISPDVSEVIWQPTTGLFRNYYPGISVKPNENTEYTVEAKNRGGCAARDRVTVFVICNGSNLFVPNTFSPNGDGTNDIFYPRGTGLFKVKSLRIFTRWGELTFERTNFDANNPAYGWDGSSKGQKVNPDVFVYTMEVVCDNGSVLTYRGNISLVK